MNKLPEITIVTPVLNAEKYIEATMQSVLGQNYPKLNYIVVDGGSTDSTVDIIKKYAGRLSCWISEKDNGLYDALNKGFAISTGEIMCYINADDLHHPGSLFTVAEIFNQLPEVEWITGNPTCFDKNGICREIVPQRKWSLYQYLLGDYSTIQQESVFWRRSLWDRAGATFSSQYKLAGDFELWLRFFRTGTKLYSTRALLGGFRRHGEGQLTHLIDKYSSEINHVYQQLQLTEKEKEIIRKIRKLEKINKIPFLRSKLKVYQKLNNLYDFPPEIIYDFNGNKYSFKW